MFGEFVASWYLKIRQLAFKTNENILRNEWHQRHYWCGWYCLCHEENFPEPETTMFEWALILTALVQNSSQSSRTHFFHLIVLIYSDWFILYGCFFLHIKKYSKCMLQLSVSGLISLIIGERVKWNQVFFFEFVEMIGLIKFEFLKGKTSQSKEEKWRWR